MLKMILADDEPVITKGIRKLIDFNSLGIEIAGVYEDGKAAMDGIVTHRPDLALLDIYMPKKTGIDILKEINSLGIQTKVIFISGFQDFQYARDALTYGAVDYLLKPVIREELISTIEKCIQSIYPLMTEPDDVEEDDKDGLKGDALGRLVEVEVEECCYLPVVTEILPDHHMGQQERKLVQFSVLSFLEQYMDSRRLGIVFTKNGHMVLVFKNPGQQETGAVLEDLRGRIEAQMHVRLGFVIGEVAASMGEIPERYKSCLALMGYFYFADQLRVPVLTVGKPVFRQPVSQEEVRDVRNQMTERIIAQDEAGFRQLSERLKRLICILSDGRRDDACFHYGSAVRVIEERFEAMGVEGLKLDFKEMLEQARQKNGYEELTLFFDGCLIQYKNRLKDSVAGGDKKDIIQARVYIEEHYRENLTLEVLAGVVHMNSYYFSSFFKKNSGENFKDYLNKIRMEHAVAMLVSTDKRAAEIAEEVGFRDGRSFAELFQRVYGETPSAYRKRLREKSTPEG